MCHIQSAVNYSVNRIFQYELFQGINARSHYCSVMFGSHNDFESTNKRKR